MVSGWHSEGDEHEVTLVDSEGSVGSGEVDGSVHTVVVVDEHDDEDESLSLLRSLYISSSNPLHSGSSMHASNCTAQLPRSSVEEARG